MNKIYKFAALLSVCLMAFAGCSPEELSTDQFVEDHVVFLGMAPNPVLRGGELRFMGSNLERITEVRIPGVDPITEITQNDSLMGRISEIRVTVPKDGPEVGKVILVDKDGNEYASKTELSYLEPITISALSPESVKPGDVLTIKGDYLNFMQEVVFSDNVRVSVTDFKKHTRYEIQVVVPVEARTGLVALGDIDELNAEDKTVVPNLVYSEKELTVAQPEVTKMQAPRYKVGETVTVTGKNFQYVATVRLPGKDVTDFKVNADNTVLTFTLPAEAQDGEAYLVAKSKVEVLAGKYVTVAPTTVAVAPKPVKAGAVLTVSGKDLDVITTVTLPNSGDLEEFELKDGNITFTVPAEAQEGDIALKMANGKEVKAAYTLVKPVVTEYSVNPAAAGSPIKFTGTDLDLVVSVTFGGDLVVEVKEPAATEFEISVPTTAENGKLLFNLANGTAVEGKELKVNKPVACYITELPGEDQEINGGQVLVLPVENGARLTKVLINDEEVGFLLNESDLYITIPKLAKAGTKLVLVSDNGSVEYTIDCIPATEINTIIWAGQSTVTWSGGAVDALSWGKYDWSAVQPGTILTAHFVVDDANPVLRFGNGSWASLPSGKALDGADGDGNVPITGMTSLSITLTEADLEILKNEGGLVVCGTGYTISKIVLTVKVSLETTIWEGLADPQDYAVNLELGGEDNSDWINAGLKVGQTIRIYFNLINPAQWSVQVFGAHWGDMVAPQWNQDNSDGSLGYVELEVTEAIHTNFTTQAYWGKSIILQGAGLTFTKITLE